MEERLSPSSAVKAYPPPLPAEKSLETYVVQIPRDQIYRIPPPEHARIVEHYSRTTTHKEKSCRSTICYITIPIFLLCMIIGIAVAAIRATLYKPTSPEFSVIRIQAKNLKDNRRPPEYDITLRAKNPNTRMSVSYQGRGVASLVFKNQKIGKGGIGTTIKDGANVGAAVDIPVVLSGNGVALSTEIKKRLNDAAAKSMVLKIAVPMEIKSWVRNEQIDLKIYCDFTVQNSLMNKTRISFQECQTEFRQ